MVAEKMAKSEANQVRKLIYPAPCICFISVDLHRKTKRLEQWKNPVKPQFFPQTKKLFTLGGSIIIKVLIIRKTLKRLELFERIN